MKTSITISLLPSKATMPFVLGPDLRSSVPMAAQIGYDAFELFPPSLEVLDEQPVAELCREHDIQISTIGTGGGAVSQGLTLTDPDGSIRGRAFDYVSGIIERAGELGAPAIIGSMQGRVGDRSRPEVLNIIQTHSQGSARLPQSGINPFCSSRSIVTNQTCSIAWSRRTNF